MSRVEASGLVAGKMGCHVILIARLAVSPPADEGNDSHRSASRWPAESVWRFVDRSDAVAFASSAVIKPPRPLRNVSESNFPAGIRHLCERGLGPGVTSPRRCDVHRPMQPASAAPGQAEDASISPASPAEAIVGEGHARILPFLFAGCIGLPDPVGQESRNDRGDEHLPVDMLQAVLEKLAISVSQVPVAQGGRHFSLDCKRRHHDGLIRKHETGVCCACERMDCVLPGILIIIQY